MAAKTQASQDDSPKKSTKTTHGVHHGTTPDNPQNYQTLTSEGSLPDQPEEAQALQDELAELGKPGQVSKSDADFIDKEPGYSKDQLAHMREYYGIARKSDETADVAPV